MTPVRVIFLDCILLIIITGALTRKQHLNVGADNVYFVKEHYN